MHRSYDPEMGSGYGDGLGFTAFAEKSVRLGFIRKVYGILAVQLLVTFSFVLLPATSDDLKLWAVQNNWLLMVSMVATLVIMIALACTDVHRQYPANFICLGIFTLAESVMFFFVGAVVDAKTVMLAILITTIVVGGLTLFAFQTKIDFTVYNGLLFVCLLVLMVVGLISMFVQSERLKVVYAGLGALLFAAYLVVDTQMIVGGTHKQQLSPEDYIFGAIILYVDIINLFLFILQLLNSDR